MRTLASVGRIDGAVDDAVVALTAERSKATLVTAGSRAVPVYELIGVDFRRLAPPPE